MNDRLVHRTALDDDQEWETVDRLIFKKINSLIKEILRRPFAGSGKPEPLKHELAGFWSRRITSEHRLVYKVELDSGTLPPLLTPLCSSAI